MDSKLENILNLSLDQVMSDRFGRYSKYIIQDRALPDVRDGLKPVQRRILYSMNELGLLHNKQFKKSARVVGEVIGKYHPHGDSSIYEAMVRMSQAWKINIPLIQMHGNNGSIDDDPAAAMRYTEARLSKISSLLLENIKKQTVPFAPNFDDSEREPIVLPGLMPNLLVNGAKGIAAGYATEIPPHNLEEIIDGIIYRIQNPECDLGHLMEIIKGPDFPTGGTIQGKDGIKDAFATGRGRIVIRSKYKVKKSKTSPAIYITEIPYGVVKSKLVKEIDEIRFNKKISGIKEVRDETDRKGITICIDLTPKASPDQIIKYLLSKTDLQVYYSYNVVAIDNKTPRQMGLIQMINSYLDHQKDVQTRALKFDLEKYQTRLEIIIGLIKVGEFPDEIIETIKKVEGSKSGVVKALMARFKFTKLQAEAIAELRLYRLSRTDQSVYHEEKDDLEKRVASIEKTLGCDKEFNKFLINRLNKLKHEYAEPRKSQVQDKMETVSFDMDSLIKHEEVYIGISRDGYLKRFSKRAYDANTLDKYVLKDKDKIIYLDFVKTTAKLLIFTSFGNYMILPAHKIQETKFKDIGRHLNDFATLKVDEKIIEVIGVFDFEIPAVITQVTELGKAKRTKVSDFMVSRFGKTYTSMKIQPEDKLIGARLSNGYKKLIIINTKGKATKYIESLIPIQGTKSGGIRAIKLLEGKISTFALADEKDILGLISKRGGAKRIKVSDIAPMSKSTRGRAIYKYFKTSPQSAIEARVVSSATPIYFSNKLIKENMFKNVNITGVAGGFSSIKDLKGKAKIAAFDYVHHENDLLVQPKSSSEEDRFSKAEQAIEAVDQISFEDIMKDIK